MPLDLKVLREMFAAGLSGLRRAAIALPVVWTGAWLSYYGQTCSTDMVNELMLKPQHTLTR